MKKKSSKDADGLSYFSDWLLGVAILILLMWLISFTKSVVANPIKVVLDLLSIAAIFIIPFIVGKSLKVFFD